MVCFSDLYLTKRVGSTNLTFSRLLEKGKPVKMTAKSVTFPFLFQDEDAVTFRLEDKAFETHIFLLENWLISETTHTHLKSVIRQTSDFQRLFRCKLSSQTKIIDNQGNVLHKYDITPQCVCDCEVEVKCVYFTQDAFGMTFHLKQIVITNDLIQEEVCRVKN